MLARGMVAWAGGGAGPDFFIYTAPNPATGWFHDHTVIGELVPESLPVIAFLDEQPVKPQGDLKMFVSPVKLTFEA